MSNQSEDKDKYIQQLETLLTIVMHKLNNDVTILESDLANIEQDTILDVVSVEDGLRITMIKDV